MRFRVPLLAVVIVLCFCQSGCAWLAKCFRKRRVEVPAARALLPVGTIVLVNDAERFVLIDSGSLPIPPQEQVLTAFRADSETARLKTDVERRHPFTVATIVSGIPGKGDRVFEVRTPEKSEVAVPAR